MAGVLSEKLTKPEESDSSKRDKICSGVGVAKIDYGCVDSARCF